MGSKLNPGRFDCYANADPREEMFVLLGRDKHAPGLVRLWALLRHLGGEDPEIVAEALQCADKLDAWALSLGKRPSGLHAVFEALCGQVIDSAEPADAEELRHIFCPGGHPASTPTHEGSLASSLVIAKGEIGCLVLALERIKAKALVTSTEPSDMLEAIERLGAIGAEVVAAFQARAAIAKAYEGHRP